jgi:hypothetical protein
MARIALLLMICALLAGCGGDDSSSGATKPSGDLDSPEVARLKAAAPATGTVPEGTVSAGFLRAAFNSAQSMWRQKFEDAGLRWEPAHLTVFDHAIDTACGHQTADTGPFYCPADRGVYLNTAFFASLARAFRLNSPFAPGYVTAHEVGHHVQQVLGLHSRVAHANAQDPGGTNARSIRVELQADCYAGIWLHHVARAGQLSDADVSDILRAAALVGDDFQRNLAGADLAPETWTHGSSEQRVHWVSVGKRTGLPADCETFG